jgi:hypothetical protein
VRLAWKLAGAAYIAGGIAFGAAHFLGRTLPTTGEDRTTCIAVKSTGTMTIPPLAYLQLLRPLANDGQRAANASIRSAAESLAQRLPPADTPNAFSTVHWNRANAAHTELVVACNALGIGPYESPPHV